MALAKALDCEPPAGWNDGCVRAAGAGWKEDCVWTRASSLCLSENLCGAPWESDPPPAFRLRSSLRVVEMIWVKCLEVAGSNWRTSVNGFFSPGHSANSSASW